MPETTETTAAPSIPARTQHEEQMLMLGPVFEKLHKKSFDLVEQWLLEPEEDNDA